MNRITESSGAGQGRGDPVRASGPGFKIGEIGGKRPQGILAHALLDEVVHGRDILIREQGSQLIAALEREHARERVELVGACVFAVSGGGEGGPGPQASPISGPGRPQTPGSASLAGTIDKP